jgi:hypothetical protein
MAAVEVELQRVTATLKNEAHVERVAALHEVTDYAQPNPRVPVRISMGIIGGTNRLQHSRQASVREAAQTSTECRQGRRFHLLTE